MNRIVLVGFSGAGKSTVGKKLASKLNLSFIDADEAFEEKYHISIINFFKKYDENFYRQCEHILLNELLKIDDVVLATGGGAPCFFDNMKLINDNSLSVYIEMSNNSLYDRLLHAKRKRPLTSNKTPEALQSYIENAMKERAPFYRQAHIKVKGENFNIDNTIEQIKNYISEH